MSEDKYYIARDEDGSLWCYRNGIPRKNREMGFWTVDLDNCEFFKLPSVWFPKVKWEDDEPAKLTLLGEILVACKLPPDNIILKSWRNNGNK